MKGVKLWNILKKFWNWLRLKLLLEIIWVFEIGLNQSECPTQFYRCKYIEYWWLICCFISPSINQTLRCLHFILTQKLKPDDMFQVDKTL